MSAPASNKSRREALRGAEVHTLDLIFEALTSEQWAELLRTPLQRAAAKGNRDLALRLVRAGAEIGDALHRAIDGGHGEIVSDLVESGASLAVKIAGGLTPLHVAAIRGETEMVQLLLLKGADKDAFDNEEMTPLFWAASEGHVASALALLAAGADVSLRCGVEFKIPVMCIAAKHGLIEILRAVIEHGADVDAVDGRQSTALHGAAFNKKAEAIDVLVEAGTNIEARNIHGSTPLHLASMNLSHEALLCLLKHGAAVNARNDSHQTSLMYAAYKAGTQGAAEVVDILLRAGADETVIDNDGQKALDIIGDGVEEENRLAEDVERVSELLANAPADRAWRRRGFLVLCRAHPDRVQQSQVIRCFRDTGTARMTRSRAKRAREREGAGDDGVDESTGADWAVVVAKVLQWQEEGIFRTIVGYM